MWYSKFPISDCTRIDEDDASPIYRDFYSECEIQIDNKSQFEQLAAIWKIYRQSEELKSLEFTPIVAPKQSLSNYYFLRLDFKIPRPIRP